MNRRDLDQIGRAIEELVDATTLHDVVATLALVAHEKSRHLESNWGDRAAAKNWSTVAHALDRTADRAVRLGI